MLPLVLAGPAGLDPWTSYTLNHPNQGPLVNTLGLLDPTGSAVAQLAVPTGLPVSLAGVRLDWAGVVLGPTGPVAVTNHCQVRLYP